jgi:DUF4097 and DUF4098 domain-containing protein YvlB
MSTTDERRIFAMPEFETPEPIAAVVDIALGEVRIAASDRVTTRVEVRPSDPARPADVTAAEQTRVEYDSGRLFVKTARRWRSYGPFRDGGSVDVRVALPAASRVTGAGAAAAFRCTGPLGDCRIKTAAGDIHVEQAATARLETSAGDITLERALGDADVRSASGAVRVGEVRGAGVIKSSNGDTRVGAATGDLRVSAANGDIAVERSGASLVAKTAKGDIHLGAAGPGLVVAETGVGGVDIAVPEGTAAWLDLSTGYGQILNALDAAEPPGGDDERVEVRARTASGDITIRRRNGSR